MKVLLLGSGGREHALAWKISQSSLLTKLYVAPGNAGTSQIAENVALDPTDFKAVRKLVKEEQIELVVVGPEAPLVAGIVDFFKADKDLASVAIVGPDKFASQLEGSKDFAKQFMRRHRIPTARYATFTAENLEEAYRFLDQLKGPYVLKADGLAAGKGVLIIEDLKEAKAALKEMLEGQFGEASRKVVIEEFLKGIELSVFAITDGKSYKLLPSAKDYKRIGEGDTGLNTGGMGAVSPVPFADAFFMEKVEQRIVVPTIEGIHKEGLHYTGFVFFGLIKVGDEPYVIEYNCRMGDPETEVVIPRVKSDLLALLESVSNQTLSEQDIQTDMRSAATVMMVSGGYPGNYQKGKTIKGIEESENAIIFHAGTKLKSGKATTDGGRVLAVTALGGQLQDALRRSYATVEKISFEGAYYRKDIGKDVLNMKN